MKSKSTNKLNRLIESHRKSSMTLQNEVKRVYPVGTYLSVKLHSGPVISAEVTGHSFSSNWPTELSVRNLKTGKTRNITTKQIVTQ